MRVEEFDDSVSSAGQTIVTTVIEAHGQDGPLVDGHFHDTGIGNVHPDDGCLALPIEFSLEKSLRARWRKQERSEFAAQAAVCGG